MTYYSIISFTCRVINHILYIKSYELYQTIIIIYLKINKSYCRKLIPLTRSLYNIGIDAGDNIMNILLNTSNSIPNESKISFVIPELDDEYNIKVLVGNNILATDNIILDDIMIKCNEKVLFLTLTFEICYIFITIETKCKTIYANIVKYNNDIIPYYNKDIDVESLKIQFEVNQLIKQVNKRINNNSIVLSDDEKIILNEKLTKIQNNITTLTNQKLLDIKNTLKTKFFLD